MNRAYRAKQVALRDINKCFSTGESNLWLTTNNTGTYKYSLTDYVPMITNTIKRIVEIEKINGSLRWLVIN